MTCKLSLAELRLIRLDFGVWIRFGFICILFLTKRRPLFSYISLKS